MRSWPWCTRYPPSGAEPEAESSAEPDEVRLRQEESVLCGRGWLGLGRSATTHGDHSVRYIVQEGIP